MKSSGIPLLALGLICATLASAQPGDELRTLRKDMEALREGQKAIQTDLEAIKKLLQQAPSGQQPQPFKEAIIGVEGAPVMGEKNARVTLIEFSDYQCPFCARNFQQTFPQIVTEYIKTGKVKYIFRDFPLESIHPHAFKAAEAARCGGEQGKYWEMHDKLFANQTALGPDKLSEYALSVGLDGEKFKECLDSGRQSAKIRNDLAEGRKIGVQGTPGFFLGLTQPNETTIKAVKFINGAVAYASFKDAIEELLKQGGK